MLKTEIQQPNLSSENNLLVEEDDDIKEKPIRMMTTPSSSFSPEPQLKKGRKKAYQNPNKKDKAGRTKIFSATTAGHLDKVKALVESGADVNFKDNAGWTPLHEAALKGQFAIAHYLIECGAEINVRGFSLDTPLHDACNSNASDCVQLLVDAGADVFALNEDEKRPIDLCTDPVCHSIIKKKMKTLDQLINRDKEGRSSLHRACLKNKSDLVRSLIEQGADVNAKDNDESTPLHLSSALGHLESVELLIQNGAIVNMTNSNLDTPLHEASRHGHASVVDYLISSGADVNLEDAWGHNPYQLSAAYPSIRQRLTARMDEVRREKESSNALDEIASKTALRNEPERQLTREERKIQNYMRAFANLDTKPVTDDLKRKRRTVRRKSLSVESDQSSASRQKKNQNPFKKDTSGRTLLHKYAKRGDAASLESLLMEGGNPNEKDHAGWTPLHEAALNGHVQVSDILLSYGADVNAKGADLDTPLHDATENNHVEVVELLLANGADPFVRNAHDAEPLDIAMEHDFQDIILILQSTNPVVLKKKKTKKLKREEPIQDVLNQTKSIIEEKIEKPQTKKRRLIQAADLEKNKSSEEDKIETIKEEPIEESYSLRRQNTLKRKKLDKPALEIKQEEITPIPKINYYPTQDIPQKILHSPIHTPPPDTWNTRDYSPLYTVQINPHLQKYYVIDLQVSLFLGLSLERFWNVYGYLSHQRKLVHTQGKTRLWSTLKPMLSEEKPDFLSRQLYFIPFDDVLDLIKRDFNHLGSNVLTITLDIGYDDEPPKKLISLPPKMALKMKKCGYKFQQYSTSS